MNRTQESYGMDMSDILNVIYGRWWVLLLTALLGISIMLGYALLFTTPTYTSTVKMYVNNREVSVGNSQFGISSSDIYASQSLVKTYCEILKTRDTMEMARARYKDIYGVPLRHSASQMLDMVDAQSMNDTEIFAITVQCEDAREACIIATMITDVLPERISQIIDGSSARTVEQASVATTASGPSYASSAVIGLFGGLIIGLVLVFLSEYWNDKLKSEEWLTKTFEEDIPLLAVIPEAMKKGKMSRGSR